MKVNGAVHTDRGLVRRENQDSYGFSAATGLYVVADGMGGRAAGKRASEEATRVVLETVEASRGEATERRGASETGHRERQRSSLAAFAGRPGAARHGDDGRVGADRGRGGARRERR